MGLETKTDWSEVKKIAEVVSKILQRPTFSLTPNPSCYNPYVKIPQEYQLKDSWHY